METPDNRDTVDSESSLMVSRSSAGAQYSSFSRDKYMSCSGVTSKSSSDASRKVDDDSPPDVNLSVGVRGWVVQDGTRQPQAACLAGGSILKQP
jgi:hypothetical protein